MAISRDYARLMGGDLTVTSCLGAGSVFRLETPVQEVSAPVGSEREAAPRIVGLRQGQAIPRVLVVEDGEENRALLVRLLERAGFDVREAVNGQEAVALFGEFRPAVVFMDIRMPVMDGVEATRWIRMGEGGDSAAIIALSAHGLLEERERVLASGFDAFVSKPYRAREIFDVMARHLGLEYLYEDGAGAHVPAESGPPVTPARLASLPGVLRDRLYRAVLILDSVQAQEAADEVAGWDPQLGRGLQTLVANFEFGRILEMLEGSDVAGEEESGSVTD